MSLNSLNVAPAMLLEVSVMYFCLKSFCNTCINIVTKVNNMHRKTHWHAEKLPSLGQALVQSLPKLMMVKLSRLFNSLFPIISTSSGSENVSFPISRLGIRKWKTKLVQFLVFHLLISKTERGNEFPVFAFTISEGKSNGRDVHGPLVILKQAEVSLRGHPHVND